MSSDNNSKLQSSLKSSNDGSSQQSQSPLIDDDISQQLQSPSRDDNSRQPQCLLKNGNSQHSQSLSSRHVQSSFFHGNFHRSQSPIRFFFDINFLSPIMLFKSSPQTIIGSQQNSQVFPEFNKGFIQFHDTKALFCSSMIEEAGFYPVFIPNECYSLSPIKYLNLSQIQLTFSAHESNQTVPPPLKKRPHPDGDHDPNCINSALGSEPVKCK